jgi:hypothetical protein
MLRGHMSCFMCRCAQQQPRHICDRPLPVNYPMLFPKDIALLYMNADRAVWYVSQSFILTPFASIGDPMPKILDGIQIERIRQEHQAVLQPPVHHLYSLFLNYAILIPSSIAKLARATLVSFISAPALVQFLSLPLRTRRFPSNRRYCHRQA